jgi:hypothetical protein
MIRSVESELEKCFDKVQERLLMASYDVEFKNKEEIIEKVSESISDVIDSTFFSELIVEIVVQPEYSNSLVGKFTFGNSMDFIEDAYFSMNDYYKLFNKSNYVEFNFVLYDYDVYNDIYSYENKPPKVDIYEIIDGHIDAIKSILKAYDFEPKYDDVLNAVTFKMLLEVGIKRFLV